VQGVTTQTQHCRGDWSNTKNKVLHTTTQPPSHDMSQATPIHNQGKARRINKKQNKQQNATHDSPRLRNRCGTASIVSATTDSRFTASTFRMRRWCSAATAPALAESRTAMCTPTLWTTATTGPWRSARATMWRGDSGLETSMAQMWNRELPHPLSSTAERRSEWVLETARTS